VFVLKTAHRAAPIALTLVVMGTLAGPLQAQKRNKYGYPEKHAPRSTTAAITQNDLMTRLYIFADDSMMGRQVGRVGNMKGTAYIARELQRLGVQPAGDNGTYFQELPASVNRFTDAKLSVDGADLRFNTDFTATPGPVAPKPVGTVQVVFGGVQGDTVNTITAEQANGKFVVVLPAQFTGGRGNRGGGGGRGGAPARPNPLAGAAAVAVVNLDNLSPAAIAAVNTPERATVTLGRGGATGPPAQPQATFRLTSAAAAKLFGGKAVNTLTAGAAGGTVTAELTHSSTPKGEWARNVVGIVPGSDPKLNGQYVAIGAHPDHVGFNNNPVDHDSAFAALHAAMLMSIVGRDTIRELTPEQRASIRINVDSLRKIRPARRDSISNGADDDGSGSMAVLEIAEAIARMQTKPRRSILFVWHNGEESGLQGSRFFTENPTVPKDSIVAQINIDMIGRGRAEDVPGGGPNYLGVVGSNRLSAELGSMVAAVNKRQKTPFQLDYRMDEDVTRTFGSAYNNIYGRSDHANYARIGIPIAFFFTGLHGDYHRVTDEPQYIDYPHYTRITNYIRELLVEVANRDKRPSLDKPIS
jgi:Peptidase family M28